MRKVRFPNSLPYLFSALKVGASLSVIAAIVTEYFGAPPGLGRVHLATGGPVSLRRGLGGHHRRVAGLAFYGLILLAERLVMPWHVSQRLET